jgi:hypothetical protein
MPRRREQEKKTIFLSYTTDEGRGKNCAHISTDFFHNVMPTSREEKEVGHHKILMI